MTGTPFGGWSCGGAAGSLPPLLVALQHCTSVSMTWACVRAAQYSPVMQMMQELQASLSRMALLFKIFKSHL